MSSSIAINNERENIVYTIYSISSYTGWTDKKIKENGKSFSLELVCKKLEKDKGFHERISKDGTYVLFGDIDHYNKSFEDFSIILIEFLNRTYNIQLTKEDISYTENNEKEGSYHFSIPKYNASCKHQKIIMTKLFNENKEDFTNNNSRILDTTIYSNKWIRMPNQRKGDNSGNAKHIIKRGTMKAFVLSHIPEHSININHVIIQQPTPEPIQQPTPDPTPESIQQPTQEISEILSMLSQERTDNRNDWLSVGFALHNDNPNNLNHWIAFSRRSNKFKEGECDRLWSGFNNTNNGITIATLRYWAKNDNPTKYKDFMSKNPQISPLIDKAIKGTDESIGKLMHHLLKDEWVICNGKFYFFNGNRWEDRGKGNSIRKEFEQVRQVMNIKRMELVASSGNTTEQSRISEYESKIKQLSCSITSLETTKKQDAIIRQLHTYLEDLEFCNKLDTNRFLLGFDDGVFDLDIGTFRRGQPSDYISLSCGWSYSDIEKVSNDELKDLKRIIKKILPYREERNYLLNLYATCLNGHSPPIFQINTGYNNSGGNGKSFMRNLMMFALGKYGIEFSVSLITQKRAREFRPDKHSFTKRNDRRRISTV